MIARFRLHLESFETRIVPDGSPPGYPGGGYPGGGYPPPGDGADRSGELNVLLDAYGSSLSRFSATVNMYNAAVAASTKARTEFYWYDKIAKDTLATIIRMEQAGTAEPLLIAALQTQLGQAQAGATARRKEWSDKFDAAELIYRDFDSILSSLQTTRNMISSIPNGDSAFFTRYGVRSHSVTVPDHRTSDYIDAQAKAAFERGDGHP